LVNALAWSFLQFLRNGQPIAARSGEAEERIDGLLNQTGEIVAEPFGFNAILGLIGLSGILMRNTLILIGQIHSNQVDGLDPYHAIIEATVQRSRPVILTALAAVLAFIPLTHSVFWGSMAYVLIGGTAVGTVLTLAFLPALYAIWFRVGHVERNHTGHRQAADSRFPARTRQAAQDRASNGARCPVV
jgi:hypothetical protein